MVRTRGRLRSRILRPANPPEDAVQIQPARLPDHMPTPDLPALAEQPLNRAGCIRTPMQQQCTACSTRSYCLSDSNCWLGTSDIRIHACDEKKVNADVRAGSVLLLDRPAQRFSALLR